MCRLFHILYGEIDKSRRDIASFPYNIALFYFMQIHAIKILLYVEIYKQRKKKYLSNLKRYLYKFILNFSIYEHRILLLSRAVTYYAYYLLSYLLHACEFLIWIFPLFLILLRELPSHSSLNPETSYTNHRAFHIKKPIDSGNWKSIKRTNRGFDLCMSPMIIGCSPYTYAKHTRTHTRAHKCTENNQLSNTE